MISRCLHHAQRIGSLPLDQWKAETLKLPERCEFEDCSKGNCREICQVWLRGQFMMRRCLARMSDAERKQSMRGGR